MKKIWKYGDDSAAKELSLYKKNPLLAKLLAIRNINSDSAAEKFLNPEKVPYIPFSAFNDSEKVLNRILKAVESNEKIIVYGDFDADGITSTAILYKTLSEIGANVGYYIPDRDCESHGLNNKALIQLISKRHAKLIITVDCGISNLAEVKLAKSFKTDVIITDHHEAPENLPDAYAIIDAKASSYLSDKLTSNEIESLCMLSGAGISFKLSCALLEKFKKNDFKKKILPIAALGTVGDIVPLKLENRRLVTEGLKLIRSKENLGITKLFEKAGVNNFEKINSTAVAFTAVPRLNASGRLASAEMSFKLLISDDEKEINEITKELNELNQQRQLLCEEANNRAAEKIRTNPEEYKHSVVLQDDETHVGIIGLAASRLVELFNKPAFIMRKDGNKYRCSCRGPVGINIYDILNDNADLFESYGGHRFAGGFSFDAAKVSFEQVKNAINQSVIEQTNGEILFPVINIDTNLTSSDLTLEILDTIKMLEPFGAENHSPVFSVTDTKFVSEKLIGNLKNHLQLYFATSDGKVFNCLKWNTGSTGQNSGEMLNLAVSLEENVFNGNTSLQLMIKDLDFPNAKVNEETSNRAKIIDNRQETGGFDIVSDYIEKTEKKIFVYAKNTKTLEQLAKYPKINQFICADKNLIDSADTVIFYDCPQNIDFIKDISSNSQKTLMFMNFTVPVFNEEGFLKTLTGMLKYTCSKKSGKTTISELSDYLCYGKDCILSALKIIKEQNLFDIKLFKNGTISLEYKNSSSFENLKNDRNYKVFEQKFAEENDFYNKMKNLPSNSFKEFILE